jgi:hypothetical protein
LLIDAINATIDFRTSAFDTTPVAAPNVTVPLIDLTAAVTPVTAVDV